MAGKAKRERRSEPATVIEQVQPSLSDTFTPERFKEFIAGKLTLAQLYGMTIEEAYAIADIGYTLFEQGKLNEAQTIFEGLVIGNPYDGYLHSVLGAIYQKQGKLEDAFWEYSLAISLDPKDISSHTNRAEILLQQGQIEDALQDLEQAIKLDPDGKHPSGIRARALAAVAAETLKNAARKAS